MTVRQVVGLFYVFAALAAALGVLVAIFVRGRWAVVLYAALVVVIWGLFIAKGMVRPAPPQADPADEPDHA